MRDAELRGYTVEVNLDSQSYDVTLLASTPAGAISRTRLSMIHSHHDIRWLDAEYHVVASVSYDEFIAGREAGTL